MAGRALHPLHGLSAPCPTQALYVDRATMMVGFDREKCIACELCLNVCPYRAVEIAAAT